MNSEEKESLNSWKILTIEELVSLNKLTEVVLKDITFMQRPISILKAISSAEGEKLLKEHPDIALILYDVGLEKEPSELNFANLIRNELNNSNLRILLYLDHSELAPEEVVMKKLNVQGYLLKDRYLKDKLLFSVLNELRNYHEIVTVTKKLKSLGGNIAHEFRTPIYVMQSGIDIIRRCLKNSLKDINQEDIETCHQTLDLLERSANSYNTVIDIIMTNIRTEKVSTSKFQKLSIKECIEEALHLYPNFKGSEITLKTKDENNFQFWGSKELFIFILFNLLKNSDHALSGRKDKQITITTILEKNINKLHFRDNGRGIPASKLEHLFEDFMTSDKKGGTGIGLSFCKRVIKSFGGNITCQSVKDEYTEFILSFPKLTG